MIRMKSQMRRLRQINSAPPFESQRSERRFWADEAQDYIFARVKERPKSPCVQRVVRLLELMTAAEELRMELYQAHQDFESTHNPAVPRAFGSDDSRLRGKVRELDDHLREMNKRIGRYRWRPFLRHYPGYTYLEDLYLSTRRSTDERWENAAVRWLLRHQIKGYGGLPAPILRFRRCRQCSAWFYALTDHQRHCKLKCRQRLYSDSPEFRAKRARYMRERYRPQEKEREQRATEGGKHA